MAKEGKYGVGHTLAMSSQTLSSGYFPELDFLGAMNTTCFSCLLLQIIK
jgi:hypothetical protein